MIPKPIPSAWIRAATWRSAAEGSRSPEGWLWTSISPGCANPGSASTEETSPRATTRAVASVPSSSTVQTKHTSRPPASRMAARMAAEAAGARRDVGGDAGGTTGCYCPEAAMRQVLSGFFLAAGKRTLLRMSR